MFACVLYYLGLRAAVSVVSTLSFLFITCDLEMSCFVSMNKINDDDDDDVRLSTPCSIVKT